MPKIFISYRRDDSLGHAGRIHERLASAFGSESVFMDMDDIQPGTNFVRSIEDNVTATDVMLVLIGKNWLSVTDTSGRRRIDDPEDFVHIEISRAVERGVRIIPILLGNASMPSGKNLPDRLRPLARFQAIGLSDERWDYDMGQLLKSLGGSRSRATRRRLVQAAVIIMAVALATLILGMLWAWRSTPDVAGRWTADVRYDWGDTHSEVFVFLVDGKTLRGSASFLKVSRGILEGTIEGNRISLVTRSEEMAGNDTRVARHQYHGIVENEEIRFVMQTEGGFSDHVPIEFVAKRISVPTPGS
jgi:hypothetical protein